MPPDFPLAIVTGASSGIGAEIARQLAERGHPVLAVARRADRLDALAQRARESGAVMHVLALDLTAAGAAAKVRDRARSLGGAGWLVNSAGGFRFGHFGQADPAEQAALVRLNCEALVALSAHVVPDLLARGRGVLLNVASLAALQPTPSMAVYGATKAFVLSFSEALREELRKGGVSVTALCPGPVATEIFAAGASHLPRTPPPHEITAQACARFGIQAATRGKAIAIPGVRNRLQAISTRLAPRALVRRISARVTPAFLGYTPPKKGM